MIQNIVPTPFHYQGSTQAAVIRYDDMTELLAVTKKALDATEEARCMLAPDKRRSKFAGRQVDSASHLNQLMNEPWKEGMEAFDNIMRQLADVAMPEPKVMRRRAAWSADDGDEVSLDRLRAGQDYWRTSHRETTHGGSPLVSLLVNCSSIAGEDWQGILWRGVATTILTNILENVGYRVQILATFSAAAAYTVGGQNTAHVGIVELKRESDPVDVIGLVNATSGWALRTMWFASMYAHSNKVSGGKYGDRNLDIAAYPYPSVSRFAELFDLNPDATIVEGFYNLYSSVEWLKKELAKYL